VDAKSKASIDAPSMVLSNYCKDGLMCSRRASFAPFAIFHVVPALLVRQAFPVKQYEYHKTLRTMVMLPRFTLVATVAVFMRSVSALVPPHASTTIRLGRGLASPKMPAGFMPRRSPGRPLAMAQEDPSPPSGANIDPGTKLLLCILIDLLGVASFAAPGVGEVADIGWAPISALLVNYLFGNGIFTALALVEELSPGFDIIPTATIAWFIENGNRIETAPPPPPADKQRDASPANKQPNVSDAIDVEVLDSGRYE
jgi:hypothetical protein